MQTTPDILEQSIFEKSPELLDLMLVDRTKSTAKKTHNIIWANDNYEHLGKGFEPTSEIMVAMIVGENSKLIQPRALKQKDVQKKRTKQHAEVFTPSWIVKKMIDGVEVESPEMTKDFDEFIDTTWLEITCGEAPFIANRYEMETGEMIDLPARTGFLDRKLQRINAEVDDKEKWYDNVIRAFKASYGFEWSGDSIILARENLVFTFVDYYAEKWGSEPALSETMEIAEIVSYNIFQMDGLKQIIPLSEKEVVHTEKIEKIDIFGNVTVEESKHKQVKQGTRVKVMNWKTGKMEFFGQ